MDPEQAEQERVVNTVIGPTSEAYYTDRVRSSSAARVRAQAAQSTVTVFLGGLVGAFSVTLLADQPLLIKTAGFAAVALWLCAGLLYLRAVALPVRSTVGTRVKDRLHLIDLVLEKADSEAAQIDKRQRAANIATALAVILTLTSLGLFLFIGPDNVRPGRVLVTADYVPELKELCAGLTGTLTGTIDPGSLSTPFTQIEVLEPTCGERPVALYIPRDKVLAARLEGE